MNCILQNLRDRRNYFQLNPGFYETLKMRDVTKEKMNRTVSRNQLMNQHPALNCLTQIQTGSCI